MRTSDPRATLALACLAQLMVTLDLSVVNVALPAIRNGLHFPAQDLQWVVNAYTITFAGFLLLGGRAADLLGRRATFVAGLALFSTASLAGGLAPSQGVLIAARALQGLGGAIVAPASLSIITTTFEEGPRRNRALGVWGAMAGAGGAAGVLLGGVLTDLLSWRWILFINVPIGIVVVGLTMAYIEESRDPLALATSTWPARSPRRWVCRSSCSRSFAPEWSAGRRLRRGSWWPRAWRCCQRSW